MEEKLKCVVLFSRSRTTYNTWVKSEMINLKLFSGPCLTSAWYEWITWRTEMKWKKEANEGEHKQEHMARWKERETRERVGQLGFFRGFWRSHFGKSTESWQKTVPSPCLNLRQHSGLHILILFIPQPTTTMNYVTKQLKKALRSLSSHD